MTDREKNIECLLQIILEAELAITLNKTRLKHCHKLLRALDITEEEIAKWTTKEPTE